ncbi:dienelactone hydrolase family protein [Streptomyces sp. NPDC101234]|uniref:dienelactone hydrolase family protein n=1 Tax=Streptomyces sp. NPDC101234 TaxID=3366138 RepID=UPI00380283AF
MRFISQTSSDGVTEQFFILDEIPGVLWTPEHASGTRPLILLGHGGRQHKAAPGNVARARCYAAEGFAVVAIDAPHHGDRPQDEEFGRIAAGMRAGMAAGENPGALVAGMHSHLAPQAVADWQAVLTAVQRLDQVGVGPVGYCGMSMGCGLGIPLIVAEPRIRAAVLGLLGVHGLAEDAARITVPVQFVVQWDDQMVPQDQGLALFDALASSEKTLHANSGRHEDVPSFEVDSSLRFFTWHLS